MRLECFFASQYFPTYNGVDAFTEIECTESGWSLPDDMKPIKCEFVSCPPLLDVSNLFVDIELECKGRDKACTSLVPGSFSHEDVNDEKYRHCECTYVAYRCKKEGQIATCYSSLLF